MLRRVLPFVLATALAGCATLGVTGGLPFKTVSDILAVPNVTTDVAMCAGGEVGILKVPSPTAESILIYRFLMAPGTNRFVLMDFTASENDETKWSVYFGEVDQDKSLHVKETLTIAQAREKYPTPCSFLYPGTAV